ncbi:MAG: glycosyltransferase [Bacteroidota bacterium]
MFSGRLVDYKKIPLLIHAVEILSRNEGSVHLTVLGDGPELDQLKELTKTLNLTQVVSFPGGQYGEGARPYFQKADLLVLPSAAGLSIIHALSYGLPVITSDEMKRHGPEIEALTPEANGSFFEKDNVVDLSEKLANWGMRLQNSRTEIAEQCMSSIGDYRPENVYLKFKDAIKSR